jgi:hypothetical protein
MLAVSIYVMEAGIFQPLLPFISIKCSVPPLTPEFRGIVSSAKEIHSEQSNSYGIGGIPYLMLIKDVDQLLDMQCVIAIKDGYDLLDFSEKFHLHLSCTAAVEKQQISLIFFIRKEDFENRDVRMFLKTFNASENDGVWTVKLTESAESELNALRNFLIIPSVVLDHIYLENGAIYASIRFHRNYLQSISDEIMRVIKRTDRVSLEYLGKSDGLISVLRKIDERIPLFLFSLDSEPPESAKRTEDTPVPGKWIREIKFTSDDLINGIYAVNAVEDVPENRTQEISKCDRLYEGKSRNDVLDFLRIRSMEALIPTFSNIQGYDGKKLSMEFVIPEFETQKFLTVVSETLKAFPDWKINMINAGKFSSMLGNG